MRISGFSLLGLLAVLAIIGLLATQAFSTGAAGIAGGASVGIYPSAISAAHHSVAQQNLAAVSAPRAP